MTPKHTHDFIEICYVDEGSGYHHVHNQVYRVKRGDLFVIPVGTSHVFRPSSPNQREPLIVYNCIFRLDVLDKWRHLLPRDSSVHYVIFHPSGMEIPYLHIGDKYDQIRPLITSMHMEYLRKYEGYEAILSSMLMQLLTLVHRIGHEEAVPQDVPCRKTGKLDDAMQFIREHYCEFLTVKQLADFMYMSQSHFQRSFKRSTGLTFTQYLQNLRIQKCCELLETSDQPVHQIANMIGYKDMKFFHALFLKKIGMTPQQHRRIHQTEGYHAI